MEMRLTTTCTELRKAVQGVDTEPSMLSVWRPTLGSGLPATIYIYIYIYIYKTYACE